MPRHSWPQSRTGLLLSALLESIARIRVEVCAIHGELNRYEFVERTAGNISARVPGYGLMVIRPSVVSCDALTPELMVVTDLYGLPVKAACTGPEIVEWGNPGLRPSSDAAAHAYVYRNMPDVGVVVHTHSTYATEWAAHGEPVPCVLTMMGGEFGGTIPVGPFALLGHDSIGRGTVDALRTPHSLAVLMQSHAPFTIGKDARSAVKDAVMLCSKPSAAGSRIGLLRESEMSQGWGRNRDENTMD
ncbi:class II aldolase/adducin family protein [Arthrobacter sp. KNU40]|uniref:class II aldolase/adducin family protein n=1 Tax=Arthrobacter sp. KNU40 TaxID=3447965 RepID=UPI003F5DAA1A